MEWILLLVGLLLILGTGFFVAVEFSFISLDTPTVQQRVEEGDAKAEPLLRCLKSLSTQLSSCQLGITLTTLLTGFVLEPSLGALLQTPLAALGLEGAAATSVSLVVAMVIATALSMLLGELVPKNLSIARAMSVGRVLARPQLVFTAVFKPAIMMLNGFSNRILKAIGLEAQEEISGARTPEELSSLVRRSAEMGTLDENTASFVDRTLRFSDRIAADVMTPRMRIETVEADLNLNEALEVARRTGFSRFPVIDDSADDIRGIMHVIKAVSVPKEKREDLVAATIMSEVMVVPETIHLDALLAELREASLQMAVVVDEHGGTAGIVTLEDLVEEIVGEVADEHDRITPGILQTASDRWYFPGLLRPDEAVAQIPALKIPEGESYETVGGFVMAELGRIAERGDVIELPVGKLTVERMDGRRIDRLKFTPEQLLDTGANARQKVASPPAEKTPDGGRS